MNHEDLSRSTQVKTSSNRAFGLVFVAVFTIIALYPLLFGSPLRIWALVVSGLLLLVALLRATWLAPANRAWTAFGALLHKIVNPLVLGIMFFGVVTPMAYLMRALGKDLLRLKFNAKQSTYWIDRTPPGPRSDSFDDQF